MQINIHIVLKKNENNIVQILKNIGPLNRFQNSQSIYQLNL